MASDREYRSMRVVVLVALLAVGCTGKDEISTYKTPKKTDAPTEVAAPPTTTGDYRILGAIFTPDAPGWFFKLVGPADALEKLKPDFEKMILSVNFADGMKSQPKFDLPAGWTLGGPNERKMAIETVKVPGNLEITIVAAGGDLKANVARWAAQVGGPSDDMTKITRVVDAKNAKAVIADVRGPKNPAGGMMGGTK